MSPSNQPYSNPPTGLGRLVCNIFSDVRILDIDLNLMKICRCVLLNDGNYQETLLVCRCLQTIRWGFAAVATFSAAFFSFSDSRRVWRCRGGKLQYCFSAADGMRQGQVCNVVFMFQVNSMENFLRDSWIDKLFGGGLDLRFVWT